MKDYNPVKIAIVGCGAITRSQHLPAILKSPKLKLVALVDNRKDNAEELSRRYALKCQISDNLESVIPKVEGLLIATPNHTHFAIAELALKHGLPLFIEKPITTTYQDAIKLCELAEKNDTFISVGYKTRHYPNVKLLKKLLDENYFGKINYFHYQFGSKGGWAPVSGYTMDRAMSGGGVLVNTGSHFLDRMIYWFGEPREVKLKDDSYGGVEANCKAAMKFINNLGDFTGTIFLSKTTNLNSTFILDTERYRLELEERDTEKLAVIPKNSPELKMELRPNSNGLIPKTNNFFQVQLEEFADKIRQQGEITVDGRFAARSVKLIEDLYANREQLEESWLLYKNLIVRKEAKKSKIAIFGASGFVGSSLVERIYFNEDYDFTAFIHSLGNATRIARFPIKTSSVDLLNYGKLEKALEGHDVIVNCARGSSSAMVKGLANMIRAAKKHRIKKFIHLGSISIYGYDPSHEAENEQAHPEPGNSSYGVLKLKQDKMIFDLHEDGIPTVILCAPNISGPYSAFINGVFQKIRAREILLVDEGANPVNLIHVDNLVEAILAAIQSENGWGERYFINIDESLNWKRFYEDMNEIMDLDIKYQSVPREEVLRSISKSQRIEKSSFGDNFKTMVSGEFRDSLSMIPVFRKTNQVIYNFFNSLNPDLQKKIRQKLEKPTIIKQESNKLPLNNLFIQSQVRQVYHSPEKIKRMIDYKPIINYQQELETIKKWYDFITNEK